MFILIRIERYFGPFRLGGPSLYHTFYKYITLSLHQLHNETIQPWQSATIVALKSGRVIFDNPSYIFIEKTMPDLTYKVVAKTAQKQQEQQTRQLFEREDLRRP